MKKFKFNIHGNEYDVIVKYFEDGVAKVEVNGSSYQVEVEQQQKESKTPILIRKEITNPRSASKIKKDISGVNKITAPLPGNIMSVFVKEGDVVKKNDKLILYEAMKMENIINAEKDGVVCSVKVDKGDSVLQDDVLLEIE